MRLRSLFQRIRSWFFVVTAASALAIASSAVAFHDADGDGILDEIEEATERSVDTVTFPKPTPFGLSITSQSSGADVDDKFHLYFHDGRFQVEYFPNASSDQVAAEFWLELVSLVEWTDTNGNGTVDDGEVLSVLPLGSDGFGTTPVNVSEWRSLDGGKMSAFDIRSNGGELHLRLTIAQRFLRVSEGKILTPMEGQLDIRVNHTVRSPAARVGLELEIETDERMAFGTDPWDETNRYSADESWISVTGGPAASPSTVFFSWSNRAAVDGVSGRVLMTDPQGSSGSYRMYAIYPAGASQSVVHVSTLGVVSEAFQDLIQPVQSLGDPIVFTSSLVAVAAIVSATMILARRRRRRF